MKRSSLKKATAAAMFLALLGGTLSNTGTVYAAKEEGDKTEITFAVNGTDREAYWKEEVAAFEKENPDITVDLQLYEDFETKVNSLYASGMAPDVMYDVLKAQGSRVPLGQFADITDYVNNWEDWSDFVESARDLGSLDGVQYGVPIYADARVFLYNKDLFEEAGIQNAPTNWDELLEDHKLLTKKDSDGKVTQVGFSIPSTGSQLVNFYSGFAEENGISNIVDESTNELLFNTSEGIEAAEYIKQLFDIGHITWDSADFTLDPFLTGKAAMTITTTANYKTAKDAGLNVGIVSPLTKKEQHTFCGMHFLYISSTADDEKKDASWKFIQYVEQADQMWNRYETLNFVPLRNSLKDKYIELSPEENTAFFSSVENGTGSPRVTYGTVLQQYINTALESVLLNNVKTEDAFQDAANQVQLEIDNQ